LSQRLLLASRRPQKRGLPEPLERGQIKWLAFYQPAAFPESERFCVQWRAPLLGRGQVPYHTLFPELPRSAKSDQLYHKLCVGPLEALARSIFNGESWGRSRVLMPTTEAKLLAADAFDDLFHESPLEDRLWAAIKEQQWLARRQAELTGADNKRYVVDFALPTRRGHLVVECDGDTYHMQPHQVSADKARGNDLAAHNPGWEVLRYPSARLTPEALAATLKEIQTALHRRGGQPDPATGRQRYVARPGAPLDLFSQTE
jgi:very-short-patch-repair endonuclease